MKTEEALKVADAFLNKFSAENEGFSETGEPEDSRLSYQHIEPAPKNARGMVIALVVGSGEDAESPEIQELVARYVDALRQAHPELADFDIKTWLYSKS